MKRIDPLFSRKELQRLSADEVSQATSAIVKQIKDVRSVWFLKRFLSLIPKAIGLEEKNGVFHLPTGYQVIRGELMDVSVQYLKPFDPRVVEKYWYPDILSAIDSASTLTPRSKMLCKEQAKALLDHLLNVVHK